MSPVSRGRKKKPGQVVKGRLSHRPVSPYVPVVADAERLRDEKSPLVAEQWASNLLGSIWTAAWVDEDVDPEVFLEVGVEALVEHMVAEGTPAALSALRAVAAVGEDWVRELAGEAADALAAHGVPEPRWASGGDTPYLSGAYSMSDVFGDIELVVLGFGRDGAEHAVMVLLAHLAGPHLVKIIFAELDEGGIDAIPEAVRGEASFGDPVALSAAQARTLLEEPLGRLLTIGPQEKGPLDEMFDGLAGDPAAGWSLLRARLDALPEALLADDDDDSDQQTVTAFLASHYAEALPDRELARLWAQVASGWAAGWTGTAHRYGPLSLGFFLMAEVSQHVVIDQADLALLPEIIRRWAHFTAESGGLAPQAHHLWDEHLPVLLAAFTETYADVEAVAHRANCVEAFDLREQ